MDTFGHYVTFLKKISQHFQKVTFQNNNRGNFQTFLYQGHHKMSNFGLFWGFLCKHTF